MKLKLIAGLCVLAGVAGCETTRGIPTHGGGKRFDEEQRIVAASIRQAIGQMNLTELRGRRVQVVGESMGHEGGGSATFSGPNNVSVNAGLSRNKEDPYVANNTRDVNVASVGGSVNFQPRPSMGGSASTGGDLNYLRSILDLSLRMQGCTPTAEKPDVTLFLLVDVLGVNRARTEYLVAYTEQYQASCEVTYYALDAEGKFVFGPRQTAAGSLYRERHALGVNRVSRSTPPVAPSVPPLPVITAAPTTQP